MRRVTSTTFLESVEPFTSLERVLRSFFRWSSKSNFLFRANFLTRINLPFYMGPGARAVHFSLVFFLAFKAPPLTSFFLRIFHRERGSNARVIEVFLLVSQSVGS